MEQRDSKKRREILEDNEETAVACEPEAKEDCVVEWKLCATNLCGKFVITSFILLEFPRKRSSERRTVRKG